MEIDYLDVMYRRELLQKDLDRINNVIEKIRQEQILWKENLKSKDCD